MQTTLPSGLRVIFEPSTSNVIYCGYVVQAGTRHEDEGDDGMAHFIEHMSFKGTRRRRACHINNGLERRGGDLNAFTNKQETVYHATILRDDFALAVDILTDIVFHSTYPQREIDREVEVICDEIESYRDSPSELIFDDFEATLFNGHPLGRDILGKAERLRRYTTADARRFTEKYYRPENCVFYAFGNLDFGRITHLLEKWMSPAAQPVAPLWPEKNGKTPDFNAAIGTHVISKGTHQAHVIMGGPTFGGTDPRRHALLLLNNMLGGPGMNSRLNTSLREHAGLVYSIDSYLNVYPDTGFWNVYFGCDTKDVDRCRQLVERELRRFISTPLSPASLAAAKRQLKGQIGISCNAFENYAIALGKAFSHYGEHRSVPELLDEIDEISSADVQELAAQVYNPERLTTLIYK